jgi:Ni/Co efflux regulator RcnB
MRKMMLLAVVVAMAALMLAAAPAMANDHKDWNDKDWNDKDWNDKDWNDHKRFDDDHKRFNDDDFFDRDFDFDDLDFDSDQDADSGNVDQTFVVTNTGDNSNQCVGLQGVANTGNAQDQTSLFQIGSDADDFDFDHGGSNIDVSPTNTTTCDQEVNQAATAYDGGGGYDYYNYYNYYYYYY